jgi:hypothetical protein
MADLGYVKSARAKVRRIEEMIETALPEHQPRYKAALEVQGPISADSVRVVHAAQVHDLVGRDFRATGRQLEPQVDRVLVRPVSLDQRGIAILAAALAFGAGEPNHVGRVFY